MVDKQIVNIDEIEVAVETDTEIQIEVEQVKLVPTKPIHTEDNLLELTAYWLNYGD